MITDLVQDAKTDKESMYLLIQQFEPLINKYSRLLKYEEAKTDLIIAFIELIYRIPILKTDGQMVNYINKSLKNKYIRLSKAHSKQLKTIPFDEMAYTEKKSNQFIQYSIRNTFSSLTPMQKKIIIYRMWGFKGTEIAKLFKVSRKTVYKHLGKIKKNLEVTH